GFDYLPCSVDNPYDSTIPGKPPTDFKTDLSAVGDFPKNTARWIITVPKALLRVPNTGEMVDREFRVDTYIDPDRYVGDPIPSSGDPDWLDYVNRVPLDPSLPWDLEDASTTYCWWAKTAEAVPFTERYQFMGDPRDCPYADLNRLTTEAVGIQPAWYKGDSVAGYGPWYSYPNGYNWYFDDLESSSPNANDLVAMWQELDATRIRNDGTKTNDVWRNTASTSDCVEVDVPRFMQLLRGGVVQTESVYTTMTGFSYYYLGLGNEIGYDSSNGYTNSIPVSGKPFGQVGWGYEQSI